MVDLWTCHYVWSFTYNRKRRSNLQRNHMRFGNLAFLERICQSCCYLKTRGMMELEIIFSGTPFTVFNLKARLLSFEVLPRRGNQQDTRILAFAINSVSKK
ncbi:hypothetical protein ES288_A10G285500v1 [Gossypium darwinii]|uniref:Uncharacterized protein n=2 Tax=Gossypium TaxID=3633 RepID=A0A5D2NX81_GOSTO|nr:hypothetical protein ES288_A10G285500v1 [Gossypium darwinii]TYI08166.1 hypothetical protein ES332_A10G279900v1 [Gossypium tomentosum]